MTVVDLGCLRLSFHLAWYFHIIFYLRPSCSPLIYAARTTLTGIPRNRVFILFIFFVLLSASHPSRRCRNHRRMSYESTKEIKQKSSYTLSNINSIRRLHTDISTRRDGRKVLNYDV